MKYINALNLLNLCVKHNILHEKDGGIFVYRNKGANSPEGWYLTDKDILSKELMNDARGQDALIDALNDKCIKFEAMEF